jgi:hypothetical protein
MLGIEDARDTESEYLKSLVQLPSIVSNTYEKEDTRIITI